MIKIAFFDVDGTLLKTGCSVPSEKTVFALRQLKENGVVLCMATGRPYPVIPHIEGITFDVLLTFNGSFVRNRDGVIFKNPLDHNDKNIIIQNLKQMNRAVAISNEHTIVTNGTDDDLEQYFAFSNQSIVIADDFEEQCRDDIYQMMCSCVESEYEQVLRGTSSTQITAWWDRAGDIIPLNGGKGTAVNAVLQYYGFEKEGAVAFGDGRNDIEMLKAVGTGVAMGNAKEDVKASADAICKSVEEDGVYHYCLEKNLIKG